MNRIRSNGSSEKPNGIIGFRFKDGKYKLIEITTIIIACNRSFRAVAILLQNSHRPTNAFYNLHTSHIPQVHTIPRELPFYIYYISYYILSISRNCLNSNISTVEEYLIMALRLSSTTDTIEFE